MTRFARAEGSKGSNKRVCEEATPWEEMKKDIVIQKKKKKEAKKISKEAKSNLISPKDVNKKLPSVVNLDDKINADQKSSKKKKKGVSLEEKKKNWVIKDGKKYKIFKNDVMKPWFDLAYEENDVMTRYKNLFIKRENVDELDQYEKSLREQNLSDKEITKKMLYKEKKHHNKLRLELLRNEIKHHKKSENSETDEKPVKISIKKPKKNLEMQIQQKFEPKYEENEIMTKFEEYWILKENLQHLQKVADLKLKRIINNRTDGNKDMNLTPDEELVYRRLMKKEKRREFNLLQNYLKENKNGVKSTFSSKCERKDDMEKYEMQNDMKHQWQNDNYDNNIVKFDGYNVSKEGAERLWKLKETMLEKGCTKEEIMEVLRTERRKEERYLKRSNKLFCYQCRQPGHLVSVCPENEKDGKSGNYVICFKCGSAEHIAKNCKSQKKSSSDYPLATCFICKEVGHISRECPKNPRGLYPNGGGCKHCGSVEHLKRDCPELQKQKSEGTVTAYVFRRGDQIEGMEEYFQNPFGSQPPLKSEKPKIVKFD